MSGKAQKNYANSVVININSISKAFTTRLVLNNINLLVPRAQAVCICGVNGAGKSTLLRVVAGLLQPDHGSVQLNGYNVTEEPEKTKPKVGVILHKSMVYPNLTIMENLSFFADLYGIEKSSDRINELLKDVGLSSYRYDIAGVLSRGMLQRLSIARALVHQPNVLLADEPFTGLDVEACQYLFSVLTDFTKNDGTIIMTTHDINIAMKCCNRVVVLDKGRLIFDAETNDLDIDSFAHDYLSYARRGK